MDKAKQAATACNQSSILEQSWQYVDFCNLTNHSLSETPDLLQSLPWLAFGVLLCTGHVAVAIRVALAIAVVATTCLFLYYFFSEVVAVRPYRPENCQPLPFWSAFDVGYTLEESLRYPRLHRPDRFFLVVVMALYGVALIFSRNTSSIGMLILLGLWEGTRRRPGAHSNCDALCVVSESREGLETQNTCAVAATPQLHSSKPPFAELSVSARASLISELKELSVVSTLCRSDTLADPGWMSGDMVVYTASNGMAEEVEIIDVHRGDVEVYYTIFLPSTNRERQTPAENLSKLVAGVGAGNQSTCQPCEAAQPNSCCCESTPSGFQFGWFGGGNPTKAERDRLLCKAIELKNPSPKPSGALLSIAESFGKDQSYLRGWISNNSKKIAEGISAANKKNKVLFGSNTQNEEMDCDDGAEASGVGGGDGSGGVGGDGDGGGGKAVSQTLRAQHSANSQLLARRYFPGAANKEATEHVDEHLMSRAQEISAKQQARRAKSDKWHVNAYMNAVVRWVPTFVQQAKTTEKGGRGKGRCDFTVKSTRTQWDYSHPEFVGTRQRKSHAPASWWIYPDDPYEAGRGLLKQQTDRQQLQVIESPHITHHVQK